MLLRDRIQTLIDHGVQDQYHIAAMLNTDVAAVALTLSDPGYVPTADANGFNGVASGLNASTEGESNVASGRAAHAEGAYNLAAGAWSHVEGSENVAAGDSSHAEGTSTAAIGPASHAEGEACSAMGANSHAEGDGSIAWGSYSHVEGYAGVSMAPSESVQSGLAGYTWWPFQRSSLLAYATSAANGTASLDARAGDGYLPLLPIGGVSTFKGVVQGHYLNATPSVAAAWDVEIIATTELPVGGSVDLTAADMPAFPITVGPGAPVFHLNVSDEAGGMSLSFFTNPNHPTWTLNSVADLIVLLNDMSTPMNWAWENADNPGGPSTYGGDLFAVASDGAGGIKLTAYNQFQGAGVGSEVPTGFGGGIDNHKLTGRLMVGPMAAAVPFSGGNSNPRIVASKVTQIGADAGAATWTVTVSGVTASGIDVHVAGGADGPVQWSAFFDVLTSV